MMEPMTTAPTETRMPDPRVFDFTLTRARPDKQNPDGLTLEGYAAVFDSPTRISSWEGDFYEVIARGAFAKSISERMPVLQFDHGQHPMVGSIPLGAISQLREDDKGLFIRARLSDNWLVKPVRDAIEAGGINGMSFRFKVIRDDYDTSGDVDVRTLREVVVPELGPVVFPAYTDTQVSVRSAQLSELLKDDLVRADLARLLTFPTPEPDFIPADPEAAPEGTSDEAPDTPPTLAPAGNDKRKRYMRLADSMDRTVAAALRNI